ncbi:putative DNA primase/helicase [Algoriphagus ratkowskyi]|uniref:DNA primase n=1 Tax=Algoriphagus ratkowskyi TaxID=57028 RepID=A0A2W7QV53_9BACT|nr:DNA primase family protein [Algoriphagus ratkowskyi]PZX52458.1 putative DNA primase/helicase [Algoriphagus ratkowskyi]TXD76197.1 DNA primase [Algoriphagus ratkowskyi]
MKNINKEGFEDHLNRKAKEAKETTSKPHEEILKQILNEIEPIDFDERAKEGLKNRLKVSGLSIEEKEKIHELLEKLKLSEKHFLILTIDEIINLAKRKNWGICKNQAFVYLYNGTHWKTIDEKEFEKFLGEASEKMGVGRFTAQYFQFREKLFKQFTSTGYLPAPIKSKDKVLINLENGTFEICDNPILRPFDPSDFMRYQLPFAYDKRATAPKFEVFINRVLPERDKQKVLCEYLGYIFISTRKLKLEKVLFLYGTGANGKSVIYDIIRALLGNQNTSEYSLQTLTDAKGYERAQIADKLVNYATEINGKLESSKFKSLASGEPMEARLPYRDPFIIEDYAKLIFNTNELPKEVEFTHGFFRRFLIIPFEVTIPEKDQNKGLASEIINEELPGVFNWILTGLNRLMTNGRFSESPSIDKALEGFKTESDTVKRFLEEEAYLPDLENKILLKDLYPRYKEFAFEDGNKILSKSNFKKRLELNKIQVKRESEGWQVYISQNQSVYGASKF